MCKSVIVSRNATSKRSLTFTRIAVLSFFSFDRIVSLYLYLPITFSFHTARFYCYPIIISYILLLPILYLFDY